MPIGHHVAGKTRYVVEARKTDGSCVYRKFLDDDRLHYLFNLVPATTCGMRVLSRAIDDERDQRMALIGSDSAVTAYLSRELNKLQGIEITPERRRNAHIARDYNRVGAVHQTHQDKSLVEPQWLPEVDPETLPGQLMPVEDTREMDEEKRIKLLGTASLPREEKAPEGFDMDKWMSGNKFAIPDELLGPEPEKPAAEGAVEETLAKNESFNDQFAVADVAPPESRSERMRGK